MEKAKKYLLERVGLRAIANYYGTHKTVEKADNQVYTEARETVMEEVFYVKAHGEGDVQDTDLLAELHQIITQVGHQKMSNDDLIAQKNDYKYVFLNRCVRYKEEMYQKDKTLEDALDKFNKNLEGVDKEALVEQLSKVSEAINAVEKTIALDAPKSAYAIPDELMPLFQRTKDLHRMLEDLDKLGKELEELKDQLSKIPKTLVLDKEDQGSIEPQKVKSERLSETQGALEKACTYKFEGTKNQQAAILSAVEEAIKSDGSFDTRTQEFVEALGAALETAEATFNTEKAVLSASKSAIDELKRVIDDYDACGKAILKELVDSYGSPDCWLDRAKTTVEAIFTEEKRLPRTDTTFFSEDNQQVIVALKDVNFYEASLLHKNVQEKLKEWFEKPSDTEKKTHRKKNFVEALKNINDTYGRQLKCVETQKYSERLQSSWPFLKDYEKVPETIQYLDGGIGEGAEPIDKNAFFGAVSTIESALPPKVFWAEPIKELFKKATFELLEVTETQVLKAYYTAIIELLAYPDYKEKSRKEAS